MRVQHEITFEEAMRTCYEDYFKYLREHGVKPPYTTPEGEAEWYRRRKEAAGERREATPDDNTPLAFSTSNLGALKKNVGTLQANLRAAKPDLSMAKMGAFAMQASRNMQHAPKLARVGI